MDTFLAALLIFLGSFVQSSIGFGLAIVAAPLLFLLSPDYVPGPITAVALVLSIANGYRYRASISLKGLGAAVAGRVPGSLAGGVLLLWADTKLLSLWLGVTVISAVLVSLLPIKIAPTPPRMAVAGFLSGFMGTSTAIGGPPMALLLQHERASMIRANLSAFFVVSCVISLAVQAPAGYMNWHHLQLSLPLIPATLLGFWLATRWVDKISSQHIRVASLVLCTVSGIAAIAIYWRT
ncbi:MAG: sulfite exporter TauE/SafE family protein [Gammaproteobacteria bacterium]|nr:MAG: sulfite exporter TauE/SafE family protein [Gammaproteobacteria bacterium]RLA54067.1 MAG: sulfite exporter TauE/SafE family protein [Gammaproteobacteria bacterium]